MSHEHNHKKLGWTIILNIVITISEYIGGLYSGSLALISDAFHNFSDVLSLILGYIGEKISDKKPDKKHTFGFKRSELITAIINAISLMIIGFYLIYESIERFLNPEPINILIMLGVGSIGLFGNLASILVLNKEKDKNMNMKAAYLHLFYDTLSSVFVILAGTIIYFTKLYVIDIVVSLIISIMIFWSSFDIIKKSLHLIMEGVPENIDIEKVTQRILSIKEVKSIHNLNIWGLNSNETYLSCHICSETKKDELIKKLNKLLEKEFGIKYTTIQIEKEDICSR